MKMTAEKTKKLHNKAQKSSHTLQNKDKKREPTKNNARVKRNK